MEKRTPEPYTSVDLSIEINALRYRQTGTCSVTTLAHDCFQKSKTTRNLRGTWRAWFLKFSLANIVDHAVGKQKCL
jgi:hypothetical protein